ncbi:Fc.00g102630.m01.CDS01 [Cosmosporella sp. VM-42]
MSSSFMNRYWIPHLDIHKKVITQELQYYLGPQATVRPYTFEGEDGFLITTPGSCLTDEQIDDICRKSKELWDRQTAAKIQQNPEKPLKRPLHQPVVVSRGTTEPSRRWDSRRTHHDRRRNDDQ